MNLKTAASRLSVHYQTAYKLVRSGALTAVKIGGTYEISEAALERYQAERTALRASAADGPDERVASSESDDRAVALANVRTVAEMTSTSARGTIHAITREAARVVGDVCVVRLWDGSVLAPVEMYTVDPERLAAATAGIQGFSNDGASGYIGVVRHTQRPVLVPHVPQDRLRASMRAEHRQYLDVIGLHSLVAAPAIVDGEVLGVVSLGRSTPGSPYTREDQTFVEALADSLALALIRERVYLAGWERRREIVAALRTNSNGANTPRSADTVLRDGQFAEFVDYLDGRAVANAAAAPLTGSNDSALLPTTASGAAPSDRFALGDLDFYDEERDVKLPTGETRRFVVHRGLVRDSGAEPLALIVVAQPAPLAA